MNIQNRLKPEKLKTAENKIFSTVVVLVVELVKKGSFLVETILLSKR